MLTSVYDTCKNKKIKNKNNNNRNNYKRVIGVAQLYLSAVLKIEIKIFQYVGFSFCFVLFRSWTRPSMNKILLYLQHGFIKPEKNVAPHLKRYIKFLMLPKKFKYSCVFRNNKNIKIEPGKVRMYLWDLILLSLIMLYNHFFNQKFNILLEMYIYQLQNFIKFI